MSFRVAPLLRQRLFTTSARVRTVVPLDTVPMAHPFVTSNIKPKLGRIEKWYLPTMALIAVGTTLASCRTFSTLDAANRMIGFGVTNALHEANRKAHLVLEPTQEQKNMMLLEMYGERSSLEDMERAIAGLEARIAKQKDRNKILDEAYGDKSSIKDLQRAMRIYEVQ